MIPVTNRLVYFYPCVGHSSAGAVRVYGSSTVLRGYYEPANKIVTAGNGESIVTNALFMFKTSLDMKPGDRLVAGSKTFLVIEVSTFDSQGKYDHTEIYAREVSVG